MKKTKILPLLLSFFVTLSALYIAFKGTTISGIFSYILQGKYIYVAPALLSLWLYCYIRSVRWGLFFDRKLDNKLLFSATVVGLMANNILPARTGEVYKAYILGHKSSVSKSYCLGTVLLERLWDALTLVLFSVVIFIWVGLFSTTGLEKALYNIHVKQLALIFGILCFLILLFLLIWVRNSGYFIKLICRFAGVFSLSFADFCSVRLTKLSEGLVIFRGWKKVSMIAVLSLIIWLMAALTIYYMFKVFSIELGLMAACLLLVVIGLFVMIPSLGSLGTMQMGFIVGLGAFGINKADALSFSLVYQFVDTMPVILAGLILFWKDGYAFGKIK